jgi:hypothetical protein
MVQRNCTCGCVDAIGPVEPCGHTGSADLGRPSRVRWWLRRFVDRFGLSRKRRLVGAPDVAGTLYLVCARGFIRCLRLVWASWFECALRFVGWQGRSRRARGAGTLAGWFGRLRSWRGLPLVWLPLVLLPLVWLPRVWLPLVLLSGVLLSGVLLPGVLLPLALLRGVLPIRRARTVIRISARIPIGCGGLVPGSLWG